MISIIVVTFRRPRDLEELKESLEGQTMPHELIIIDDSWRDCGLSASRNGGIGEARGSRLLFLDDDVIVEDKRLVEKMDAALGRHDIVGGYALPLFREGGDLPPWFDGEALGWALGVCNTGIVGACFGVRRQVFDAVGYFRADLGRWAGTLMSGEEADLIRRAERAGFTSALDRGIIVRHKVGPERLTLKYMIRRHWYEGKSQALMEARR